MRNRPCRCEPEQSCAKSLMRWIKKVLSDKAGRNLIGDARQHDRRCNKSDEAECLRQQETHKIHGLEIGTALASSHLKISDWHFGPLGYYLFRNLVDCFEEKKSNT